MISLQSFGLKLQNQIYMMFPGEVVTLSLENSKLQHTVLKR